MADLPINQIVQGDCREIMREFPPESNSNLVQVLTSQIESFSFGKNFLVHRVASRRTKPDTTFLPESSMFLFVSPKFNHYQGNTFLDSEIWQKFSQNFSGEAVRCLIAIERSTFYGTRVFPIIRPSKSFFQKLDGTLIDHSHLYSFVVEGAFCLLGKVFFNTNISLPINQSGQIRFYFTHTLTYGICDINNFREVSHA